MTPAKKTATTASKKVAARVEEPAVDSTPATPELPPTPEDAQAEVPQITVADAVRAITAVLGFDPSEVLTFELNLRTGTARIHTVAGMYRGTKIDAAELAAALEEGGAE